MSSFANQATDATAGVAAPTRGPRVHTGIMRAMHWVTVGLLLGAYMAIWATENAGTPAQAAQLVMLHRSFGITVLILTLVRFAWRQRETLPSLPSDLPPIQRLAARASVVALYALLALQPVLGITASLLHGRRVTVFGDIAIPAVLPIDRPLSHQLFEVHGWTALLLLALIGMHMAAALYHHFVRGDDVLQGMLPGMRRVPRRAGTESPRVSR